MIQETYVTFEQAKALKELGFPQNKIFGQRFYNSEANIKIYGAHKYIWDMNSIFCPSQSLVQKWLREKKNLDLYIIPIENIFGCKSYTWLVYKLCKIDLTYTHYPSALSEGIDKCIEILKSNKDGES